MPTGILDPGPGEKTVLGDKSLLKDCDCLGLCKVVIPGPITVGHLVCATCHRRQSQH